MRFPPKVLLATLAYPLLAHAAALTGSPALALAALALLLLAALGPALAAGRPAAWLGLGAGGLGLAWLARHGAATLPLYAPPVLITGGISWLFGRTLRAGRVPLIERVVRALHPPERPLDPRVPGYARRLTAAWALLLATLALLNLLLAAFAAPDGLLLAAGVAPPFTVPREWWSLFANLLNYVIIAAFFAGEYAWRRHLFRDQPWQGFADFARRIAALDPRFWRDG